MKSMGDFEILSSKVKKVIEKLKKLDGENHKLKLEVDYLKKENEQNKKKIGQYIVLERNSQEVVSKIERIIKKIDTLKVS
jgi:seryl-tRNA synthetase